MKSAKCTIVLGYDSRAEIQPGVWENSIAFKTVKAERQQIYQRRQDAAMLEGFVITARFIVRSQNISDNLKYVKWNGNKYKVNQVTESMANHISVIEIGEMI